MDPFLKSHSTLSSLYAYYACNRILQNNFFSFCTMMIIQGHHGFIPSPSTAIKRLFEFREKILQQIDSIGHLGELDRMLQAANLPTFSDFKKTLMLKDLHTKKLSFQREKPQLDKLGNYYLINVLFSTLIDADRTNAANLEFPTRTEINEENIVEYCKKIETENTNKLGENSPVIQMRKKLKEIVLSKANSIDKIFSLTAPTGSGKTLTGFLFANKLRKQILSTTGRNSRIIYVCPFLSIIDQNAEVLAKALKALNQSALLLTHHHLADMHYTDVNNETYETLASQLLIEGWNAEVIITTFVQFLHTIIGTSASQLRRFHNIAGSIVILDEVQSIDHKYWSLVKECLKFISEKFDVRIILMTATQPLILKKTEIKELVDAGLDIPERVSLRLYLQPISLQYFITRVNKIISANKSKNILIIMNTIESSIKVFDDIQCDDKFYLSANIVPIERKQRIEEISKRLRSGYRTILVSTQVVEAGVDIDFNIVIRDLAPIDSLIQAAGRCNRNGKNKQSDSIVYIFSIKNQRDVYYANIIYGNYLITKTRETLSQCELKIPKLADAYYRNVVEGASTKESEEILNAMQNLDYDLIREKFHVIEDEPSASVFVEIDKDASNLWKQYVELLQSRKSSKDIRAFFLENRASFYGYVVNIRLTDKKLLSIPLENAFYHISHSVIEDYYDEKTGLKESSNIF